MVFNSINYLIFLSITFLMFLAVPRRYRWIILLIASIIFYSFLKHIELFLALVLVVVVSYIFGRIISRKTLTDSKKKQLLFLGVILDLAPLFFLRYFSIIINALIPSLERSENFSHLLQGLSTIGVSFFIFQALSYLIDIYLEIIEPESSFWIFALSLCFFPKLMQGPIERSGKLLPQLHTSWETNYQNVRDGLLRIGKGLLYKLFLADRIALVIDPIFNNIHSFSGIPLIMTIYLYSFQIYIDFLAYTEIALGSAQCFGILLTQNFNKPYLAMSIADFWRRWHISFSKWIMDYIFRPLQMKWRNFGVWGVSAALLITFLISGIWHGGKWTFVVWGLLHGVYLVIENLCTPLEKKIIKRFSLKNNSFYKLIRIFLTFNLVSLAWVFFRANTISDAWYILTHLFTTFSGKVENYSLVSLKINQLKEIIHPLLLGQHFWQLVVLILSLILFSIYSNWEDPKLKKGISFVKSDFVRWTIYYLLLLITLFYGVYNPSRFIYFNF